MPIGTVKWFNPTKGYGFIQPQGGGKDVFVHISAVERAGLSTLDESQSMRNTKKHRIEVKPRQRISRFSADYALACASRSLQLQCVCRCSRFAMCRHATGTGTERRTYRRDLRKGSAKAGREAAFLHDRSHRCISCEGYHGENLVIAITL